MLRSCAFIIFALALVSGCATVRVPEAKQEAEQALTKEEIPPASREFVRQYFSTVEQKPSQ